MTAISDVSAGKVPARARVEWWSIRIAAAAFVLFIVACFFFSFTTMLAMWFVCWLAFFHFILCA